MTDLDFFFDSSRDFAMATNQSRKIGVFRGPFYFVALPFRNGLQYRNYRFKKIRQNEFLYIVHNFGDTWSRNLRVYAVNNSTFCGDAAKSGISR